MKGELKLTARKTAMLVFAPMLATLALAQERPLPTPDVARSHGLESLRKVVNEEGVPLPPNLSKYVKDMTAAAQLGKALFHDQAVGSDAVQACVTCHFNAGADSRSENQVSPGLLRVQNDRKGDIEGFWKAKADPEIKFQVKQPGEKLEVADFPFAGRSIATHPKATLMLPLPWVFSLRSSWA